jgi:pimeloyl-ACP methyl ester carboxylesterase
LPLTYFVDRPTNVATVPLIIMVDGSNCRGWEATGLHHWFEPDETAPIPYARLFVEKRGVPKDSMGEEVCSETFLKHYSINQRVEDHLRVLQHLRAHAPWWNGTLYLAGWSDGGDIAAQLSAYYPAVDRAMLGAMGGGTTMAEQFEDVFICPPEEFETEEDRQTCLSELRAHFDTMRDNPTWKENWSGHANSYKAWATRLDTRLTHLIEDVRMPLLIVHGADDRKVPPDSARLLYDGVSQIDGVSVTFWEIPGMGHTPTFLGPAEKTALMNGMRDWLLLGEPVDTPF